jgi:MFS family permease
MVRKKSKKERELEEHKKVETKKQKSRNLSIKEGIFASAKDAFGTYFVSPFAIAINTSSSAIAIMSSITGLFGPLSQIFSSKAIEKTSRKKIVTKAVLLESLSWLAFIAIGILYLKNILTEKLPLIFLLFFSVYTIFLNAMIPAWFSWTGDIVSEKYRGRWLSKRNLLIGFTTLVLTIIASYFLEYMSEMNNQIMGFGILFFMAFLMRMVCWKIFKKQYEPKLEIKKGVYFSFWKFLRKAPKSNFGKFSIFRFFFSFSVTIANSLLAVYLLRNLNLNYTNFIIIILSATFFALLVTEIWGKIADKYGNYKVILITAIIIPIIPLLWIINSSIIYLILIPGLARGIGWAGFNLSSGNFIYDNVSQEKRGLAISYFNMMMGLGIFFGGLVGALLIKVLNGSNISPISIIFIISSITSMLTVAILLPKIKEVKNKKQEKNPKAFRKFLMKQFRPTLSEEIHQIVDIKKYIWEK